MSELIFSHGLIDPATIEMLWTMAVSALLLLAGSLTVYILPWTDAEIDSVYNALAQLPTTLSTQNIPSNHNTPARISR